MTALQKTYEERFVKQMSSCVPLTDDDKILYTNFIKNDPGWFTLMPTTVPVVQNIMFMAALAIDYKHDEDNSQYDFTRAACEIILEYINSKEMIMTFETTLRRANASGSLTIDEEAVIEYLSKLPVQPPSNHRADLMVVGQATY